MTKPVRFWTQTAFATATGGSGVYEVEARCGYTRIEANVQRNEAGFHGRQWEVSGATVRGMSIGVGDNQFPSLKAAAQQLLALAESYEDTRQQAVKYGLRPALPGDVK